MSMKALLQRHKKPASPDEPDSVEVKVQNTIDEEQPQTQEDPVWVNSKPVIEVQPFRFLEAPSTGHVARAFANPWTPFTRSTTAREVLTVLILLACSLSLINCLNNIHKLHDQMNLQNIQLTTVQASLSKLSSEKEVVLHTTEESTNGFIELSGVPPVQMQEQLSILKEANQELEDKLQEKSTRLDELQVNSDKVHGKFKHKLDEIRKLEAEVSKVEQNLLHFSMDIALGDNSSSSSTAVSRNLIPLQPSLPQAHSSAGVPRRRRRRGGRADPSSVSRLRGSEAAQSIRKGGAGEAEDVTEGQASVQYALNKADAVKVDPGKVTAARRRGGGTGRKRAAEAEAGQEEVLTAEAVDFGPML